ncbi:hypothetical protein D4764_04G0000660 [Takifugu flavidus]|uniref:Uncharacterized protein n=1 Tax=Takifugu flavidus TaxID=433684 RepID=A0A5C6N6J3_9TELE|nr:hypothetical protein D4764_04G0000660 [Takifugu flavidus]
MDQKTEPGVKVIRETPTKTTGHAAENSRHVLIGQLPSPRRPSTTSTFISISALLACASASFWRLFGGPAPPESPRGPDQSAADMWFELASQGRVVQTWRCLQAPAARVAPSVPTGPAGPRRTVWSRDSVHTAEISPISRTISRFLIEDSNALI